MPAKTPKGSKASSVPSAVPAYVNYKGTKYTVKEARGGKIKITNPETGANIKLPKGTGITAQDIKFLNAAQAIGSKKTTSTRGNRVTTFKPGRGGGAGLGGMFGVKNR